MFINYSFYLFLMLLTADSFAFPCYLTLAKDSCWTDYDVKVIVIDADKHSSIATVDVPKGQSWARVKFNCEPAQKLFYEASFSPVFWQSESGKSYLALRYWTLPAKIEKDQSAWDIPVCYPAAFSAVPFPPTAAGNCKCDFTGIPPIKPQ